MYISFFDPDFWQEIWSSLKKNKIRTFLTAFGVFWGIFMLVIMAGAGKALNNGVSEGFKNFASNSAFIWANKTGEPYKGFKRGRIWNIRNSDIAYLRDNVPEIEYLAPRLQGWRESKGDNVVRGIRSGSFAINGDYPEYRKIDPFTMVYGRFINEIDIINRRKVCIIGERVYDVLFQPKENPIGKVIRVNGVYFTVVGVFIPDTKINFGSDKKETIFMPFTTLQQTFNYGDVVHFFSFTAKNGIPVSDIEPKVIKMLKERNSIAPNDSEGVGHVNVEAQFKQMSYLFIGIAVLTWIVGLGTLLAGVIGVSNIMLIIVKERTHEIGIQRALGATPRKIITQIITESVFLTTLSGYLGLLLGILVLQGAGKVIEMSKEAGNSDMILSDPSISLSTGIIALIILIVFGAIAGMLPASRAVRMKAIDALRDE